MPIPQVPQEVVIALQAVLALLSTLLIFLVGRLFTKIDDNTASTNTIAVNSARTDSKVTEMDKRLTVVSERTHKMQQDITALTTYESVRQAGKAGRRGGD